MKLKRILTALLALILAVSMFSSCEIKPIQQDETSGTSESGGDNSKPQVEKLELIKNGKSDYKIVYPLSAKYSEKEFAMRLQAAIKQITGVELRVISDLEFEFEEHSLRQDKEILVGTTSRSNEYTIPEEIGDVKLGYSMFVANERLVILGYSNRGMTAALNQFILDQFGYNLASYGNDISKLPKNEATEDSTIHYTYLKKEVLQSDYLSGVDAKLSDFKIYSSGTALQNRVAYKIRDAIASATDITLQIAYGQSTHKNLIMLQNDGSLEKGSWKITSSGDTVTVLANGYYGFYDAIKYFENGIKETGCYEVDADNPSTGSYLDRTSGVYESTKYAYDQKGDVRVMFYNVLFGETADSGAYDVRPSYRDPLQELMIAEYMPDVLGCQEFDKTKRGYENDGSGGLAGLLTGLGYKEAVDPRVDNASNSEWGRAGATKVDYLDANGKSIEYTFYNNTPLFYNTNTTELIKAEYYWYKAQKDNENATNCGSMDCGSKAATWGVFKDKATGKQYIVVSTHMCTRSNGVRGLQGQEIVDLIKKLVAQYDCPVFFGGDMNGNIGDSNYDLFVGSAGYKSLQDSLVDGKNIATEYTSPFFTAHGYPDFNSDLRIMTPGANGESNVHKVVQTTNSNSIDQIFVTNHEDVEIGVFGVLVDDLTLSSSDHLPIFTDFSFK